MERGSTCLNLELTALEISSSWGWLIRITWLEERSTVGMKGSSWTPGIPRHTLVMHLVQIQTFQSVEAELCLSLAKAPCVVAPLGWAAVETIYSWTRRNKPPQHRAGKFFELPCYHNTSRPLFMLGCQFVTRSTLLVSVLCGTVSCCECELHLINGFCGLLVLAFRTLASQRPLRVAAWSLVLCPWTFPHDQYLQRIQINKNVAR